MRFRNPWIDPRIEQVRAAALEAYVVHLGWRPLQVSQENFQSFEQPAPDNCGAIVNIPQLENASDYVQRIIEVVSDLARAEERYAVDVLNDILAAGTAVSMNEANGAVHESTGATVS